MLATERDTDLITETPSTAYSRSHSAHRRPTRCRWR
jgi:hypothetical protein